MQKLDLDTLMNDELGEEEKPFELRYASNEQPQQQPEQQQRTDLLGMPIREAGTQTLDQTIQDFKELPFAIGDFAAALLPGAGVSEAVGTGVENPVSAAVGKEEAKPIPSLKKDVEEGSYLDASLKGLGVVGDALTLAGAGLTFTGIGSGPGAALLATGLAAKGISKYGEDIAKSLAKLGDIDEEAAKVAAKRIDDFADQDKPVGAATSMLKAEIKKARPKKTVEAKPRATAPTRELGLFNRAEEAVANMDIPDEGIRADALMARLRDDPDVPNDEIDFGIGLMTNPEEMLTREKLDTLFGESFGIIETNRTEAFTRYAEHVNYRLPDEPGSNYSETVYQLKTAYQEENVRYELSDYFSRILGYDSLDDYDAAVIDLDTAQRTVAEDLLSPQRSVQVETELDEYLYRENLRYSDLPDAMKSRTRRDYFKALASDARNFSERITDTDTLSPSAMRVAETMWSDARAISDAAVNLMRQDNPFTDGGNFEQWIEVELQDALTKSKGRRVAERIISRIQNQRQEGTFLTQADIPESDNQVGSVLYRSNKHFEEEAKNQIGHMRHSVRTTDDGKRVLVVEEIQSDAFKQGEGAASGMELPFKTKAGYTNMMLARAMHMAAEQDLDGIMVLNAAQQIKRNRNGFTNVVDRMESYTIEQPDGSISPKFVALHMKNKSPAQTTEDIISLTLDEKGIVVESGMRDLVGKPLSEVIGSKKTAQKLIDKDTSIDAEDRVIGESGYKDVYDNRIPKRLNEIAKRMDSDAKVDKKGNIYLKIVSPLAEKGRGTAASEFLEDNNPRLHNIIFQPHSDEFPGFIDDANPEEIILRDALSDGLDKFEEIYDGYADDIFLDPFSPIEDVISSGAGEMKGNQFGIDNLAIRFSVMYSEKFRNTGAARDFIDKALEDPTYLKMIFDRNVLRYKNLTGGDFGGTVDTIKNNTRMMFTPEMKEEILNRGLPRLRKGGLVGKQ